MILNVVTNGTVMTQAHLDAIAKAKNLTLQLSTHGLGAVEDTIKARPSASNQVDKTLRELIGGGATVDPCHRRTEAQPPSACRHIPALRQGSIPHHSFVMYEPMGDLTSMHVDPRAVRITADRASELQAADERGARGGARPTARRSPSIMRW